VAGFTSIRDYAAACPEGRCRTASVRKVPSNASTAQWWVDLSMAPGNPQPNYYVGTPLESTRLNYAGSPDVVRDGGIYHGDDVSPASLHLMEWMLETATTGLVGEYMLLDYLVFYPFLDLDDTGVQTLDNTVTLPRYDDGAGVRAMLVATAPTAGGGSFTFDYVDQDGAAKTSPTQGYSTAVAGIQSIPTSEPATAAGGQPFLQLAGGDTGVRSITSWTNIAPGGGLAALVLVRPLASHAIYEVSTPSEKSFVSAHPAPPRIYDGAYLGMIMRCAATVAAGLLAGRLTYVWST
jgi:hypothetical protein